MATLEILASAATIAYVVLAVRRSLCRYPIGLLATARFFVAFAPAKLYSSMALQVFALVQRYGWWYWLRGDACRPAKVTSMRLWSVALMGLAGLSSRRR